MSAFHDEADEEAAEIEIGSGEMAHRDLEFRRGQRDEMYNFWHLMTPEQRTEVLRRVFAVVFRTHQSLFPQLGAAASRVVNDCSPRGRTSQDFVLFAALFLERSLREEYIWAGTLARGVEAEPQDANLSERRSQFMFRHVHRGVDSVINQGAPLIEVVRSLRHEHTVSDVVCLQVLE